MKQKSLLFSMLAVLMLATGCTKEYITKEYITEEYYTNENYGSQVQVFNFNIAPSEWNRFEGNNLPGGDNYLYCEKSISAINNDVFNHGAVIAYAWNVYDSQQNRGAWNALPFIFPLEVIAPNADGTSSMVIVPENLRFEWELGKVTFIIQDLDGYDPEDMVSSISMKVCVIQNM